MMREGWYGEKRRRNACKTESSEIHRRLLEKPWPAIYTITHLPRSSARGGKGDCQGSCNDASLGHEEIARGGRIMPNTYGLSRRTILEMGAAAGAIALTSDITRAHAQSAAPRIEQMAPELDKILSTTEPIQTLATGFGGGGNTEGPVWWKEGGFLLFSSIGDNQVIKYTPGKGTSVYREKTNGANGHTRDMQGRLVHCEGLTRRVTREEPDGSFTVIANSYQGKRINKPNDVVVKSDGSIYFTDPWNIPDLPQPWDLDFNGVYRVSPDLGTINLLTNSLFLPNGLAL